MACAAGVEVHSWGPGYRIRTWTSTGPRRRPRVAAADDGGDVDVGAGVVVAGNGVVGGGLGEDHKWALGQIVPVALHIPSALWGVRTEQAHRTGMMAVVEVHLEEVVDSGRLDRWEFRRPELAGLEVDWAGDHMCQRGLHGVVPRPCWSPRPLPGR